MHAPKVETFDIAARSNIDPKGIAREVEEFRLEPFGLYLARKAPGRAQFSYLESWILPGLGLRITDFWFNPGHERDQDFYLDVVETAVDGDTWRTVDLYLDLVLKDGRRAEVIDTDELIAAAGAGLISAGQAVSALEISHTTLEGLAANDYRLRRWLSTKDIELSWRRHQPIG